MATESVLPVARRGKSLQELFLQLTETLEPRFHPLCSQFLGIHRTCSLGCSPGQFLDDGLIDR